jgi:PAS domain S-box-containing protein
MLNEDLERRVEERTEELRESEARIRAIVEYAPVNIAVKDMDGRHILIGPQSKDLFGIAWEEALGKTSQELFPEDFAHSLVAHDRAVLESGQASEQEDEVHLEDGVHTILTVKFPIPGSTGGYLGIGAISSDITERKRLETQLLKQERLVTLGRLTGTVSHELRNPLGTIGNSLAVVNTKTRDRGLGVEGALDRITRSIRRCDDIISELFEYATCRPIKRQDTSLDAWLAEVLDNLAVPEGVTVRRALGDADVKMTMDREQMRRVMINLCDNACQAMTDERDEEGVDKERILTIGTEAAGNEVKIFVTDTGTGMSKDTVAQIFEPLFSTKMFGVGLGLPIVKQIIERHDGAIEVTSEEGRGTRFVVRLPMVRAGGEA